MKTVILSLVLVSNCFTISAQDAVEAFAQKDETYIVFSDRGFDKQKKYVLFNFWNPNTPHTDVHNAQFQTIKLNFAAHENIEFVNIEWNTEKDIQTALEKYQIESKVEFGKNIRLTSDAYTLQTSSTNAFLLVENSKAAFLCSGSVCSKKFKEYFSTEGAN